jgi:hypothetical protein
MANTFSDWQVGKWLADIDTVWLSLHYGDPSESSTTTYEVFGGSYGRKLETFSGGSGRTYWNNNSVAWSGLPETEIAYIGGWNSVTRGNLLWSCPAPLDANGRVISIKSGQTLRLAKKQIAITIS